MSDIKPDLNESTFSEIKDEITDPPMYNVYIHNDDYTTKVFVVDILMAVFNKSMDEATQIMWHVHKNGIGQIGVYTYEIAETKINQATTIAREQGYPLKMTMEPE